MYNPFKNIVTADQLPKDCDIADIPSKSMWAFIWFFIRQAKWPLLAITMLHLLSSLLFASGPYFIKELVDGFESTEIQRIYGVPSVGLCQPLLGYI